MTNVPVLDSEPRTTTDRVTDLGFEARWLAWQQRGAAHERVVRARARVGLPILAVIAALAYYLLAR